MITIAAINRGRNSTNCVANPVTVASKFTMSRNSCPAFTPLINVYSIMIFLLT
jgi:hypothetical protein